jgi:hypothetical protein
MVSVGVSADPAERQAWQQEHAELVRLLNLAVPAA